MSKTPENSGPIRNRDLRDPRMAACWKALTALGLAVQMHFIPAQAPNIRALAERFPDTTVILDHMGRPASGTPEEYDEVLRLAKLPKVILKYSSWGDYKGDLGALTRRLYDTFGPRRIIWGTMGNTPEDFRKNAARFEEQLSFASDADRAAIRGGNVQRLFFS
jgi:predicted TIM-barrel fold metal-dependent hydrolase